MAVTVLVAASSGTAWGWTTVTNTNGDTWIVYPALRVMQTGDIFAWKDAPLLDRNNGGSGLEYAATLGKALQPLGAGYYILVAAGITASLAIIASTLPLLRRITGPETARNE